MIPPFRPPLVAPARFMFDSDEAYQRALKSFRAEQASHAHEDDWNLAVMIVAGVIMLTLGALCLGLAAYAVGGWRGIAYLVLSGGLLWVAVVRVHDHLGRGRHP